MSFRVSPRPVMLYYDPHPVHQKMAAFVDAEMVQCSTGSAPARLSAGIGHDFENRPVILEGGVPLAEGAVVRLLRRGGPLIALGADTTYHDVWQPLPGRSRVARLAHRFSLRLVDGTIAVSEPIATMARRLSRSPVRVAHPFIEADRYEALGDLDPDPAGSRILCVGKNRLKNGQHLLIEALDHIETDVHVDFVGPDTEALPDGANVYRHGFVSDTRLVELLDEAALVVFPALAGAFPVNTLEGLRAGVPVLTTTFVGSSEQARLVDPRLVVDPTPHEMARAIDWYFGLELSQQRNLSRIAAAVGEQFDEQSGLEAFGRALVTLLEDIGVDASTARTDRALT